MHTGFKALNYFIFLSGTFLFLLFCPPVLSGDDDLFTIHNALNAKESFSSVEEEIREELGIPPDAEKVAILSMSSHWDPDYLATFEMYYTFLVEKCISAALDLLEEEERYYYSISEIVFLRRYWDDHPEDHERIITHINSGHLRIVGGGMTSPDTLLPSGESLIRDWLYGNRWTMENLGIKPVTAWQPDSFGHSPSLPGLLSALGYRYVSFARADSDTSELLGSLGSADFLWEGLDGEEILAHWMPLSYGIGDWIDTDLIISPYLLAAFGIDPYQFVHPEPEFTNTRILGIIYALDLMSRTGYVFIPVGGDFAFPNPNLLTYIDNWNSQMYELIGVWCVAATFEHYAMLVDAHREEIPSFEREINPYWTGFYSTRPILKDYNQWCSSNLTGVEIFSILAGLAGYSYPEDILKEAWDGIVFLNHHDGITGTSLDYVYYREQIPMAEQALEVSEDALSDVIDFLTDNINTSGFSGKPLIVFNSLGFQRTDIVHTEIFFDEPGISSVSIIDETGWEIPSQLSVESTHNDGTLKEVIVSFIARNIPSFGYRTYSLIPSGSGKKEESTLPPSFISDGISEDPLGKARTLEVETDLFSITFSSSEGWCITSIIDKNSGEEYISGIGNDIIYYQDVGGLYRIGAEANPGTFNPVFRTSRSIGMINILEEGPVYTRLNIKSVFPFIERDIILYKQLPRIEFEADAATIIQTSVTVLFETAVSGSYHRMGIPFGEITRPPQSVYEPTFWPGKWVETHSDRGSLGFAMTNLGGRGWHFDDDGSIEVMLERHSLFTEGGAEGAFGSDRKVPLLQYAIIPHDPESWDGNQLVQGMLSYETPLISAVTDIHEAKLPPSFSLAWSDNPDIWITAVKKAEGTEDIVVRIFRTGDDEESAVIRTNLYGLNEVYEVTASETDPVPFAGTPTEFIVKMPTRVKTLLLSY